MSTSFATAPRNRGRRGRLLTAARTVFTAHGFHGANMDTVSAVADVTKPVLYRHFSTKSELYLAVILDYLDELADTLRDVRDETTSDFDRVRRTVTLLFDLVESSPHSTPELVFGAAAIGDPAVESRIAAAIAEFVATLATHLHPDDVGRHRTRLLAFGLIGATLAAAGEWHRMRQPIPRQSALEAIAGWYCSGVRETKSVGTA
ncbi:TetR/AcrR family transcriptional regulator [Nocardia sp. NPDC058633]|uniref:TetR/AcrR family transcriptional regulator n=1 Tax=Nocardia sp. NPDC058633 TaxID=3346568 RepID=UPI0036573F7B